MITPFHPVGLILTNLADTGNANILVTGVSVSTFPLKVFKIELFGISIFSFWIFEVVYGEQTDIKMNKGITIFSKQKQINY